MKQNGKWSLDRRLSTWFAIQTFLGLTLVSTAVYIAIAFNLDTRQADALAQKQSIVTHLLDEARLEGDLPNLKHKLDDFFAGHTDLVLELYEQDGTLVYRSAQSRAEVKRVHVAKFSLASTAGVFGDLTAQLSMDTRADDDLLRRLAVTLVAVALLGSLVVSAGGFLLVRLGHAPVQHLVDQTRDLAADTLGRRLDGSAQPRELQPLVEQFNALLERLGRAYEQMEGFNSDVAHELNTPLSTIITSTELALRKERDPEALRDMLGSNLEDLHRMSDIIKDMLFLSQSERGARARRTHVPSLAAVAFDVADYHEAALSDAELQVEIAGDFAGEFDVPLIKRAISNLLGNATHYAERGSTVRIELTPRGAGFVKLAVINRGQPIAAEHLPRLFDRFYRVDPSRTQAESHHGLGLAIVATIARMHGGRPFAQSVDGQTSVGLVLASQIEIS
ncbi:MAG: two-component sensor histidine kinase [Burkholderiales bacterium RIFCSPHIGHO2_12_FULL_61_11]|nr:MAG: two-component sensor histidine kinase [Burkholderiales bacterium RIFCSPHIGHO2_12_FULL_61_11]